MRRFYGFMCMVLVLACMITMLTSMTDVAYAAVSSETYTVPNGSFDEKISYLKSVFPEGWYWNEWSESKLGSYKMKKITINGQETTITTKPCASHKSGSIDESCNRYWGTMHGTQCCGYARMIYELVWGYDTFSSKTITYSYPDCVDYLDNIKPGDQIWTGTHYTFVLGVDGENVRVTDCNGKWTCGIRWSATYKKSALKNAMQNNKKGKICVPTTRDTNVSVESYTVPDGSFNEKISYLRNVLPDGWYWNNWSVSDLDDYKLKNLTVNGKSTTISTKPCVYHDSTTVRDSCNHYWAGLKGTQCCGFARMMFEFVWGYHTNSANITDYAYPAALDYLDSVKPGDMIWNGSHYMFVLGVDGENIRVVHCNNDHKCVIQWDAIYTKSAIRSKMNSNKKGYVTVPNTRTDEPETKPNWVKYVVVYGSGLRMRASAGTSASVVELMPKGTIFRADMNRTKTANGYTWAYCQMDNGTCGWVAISNPDHCKQVTENTWSLEYYLNAVFHCTQRTLKMEPYSASSDIRTMTGDEYVVTVAAHRNSYGNLWYELEDGGFVNEDNVTYIQSIGSTQYELPLYYENVINKGTNFALSGSLSSPTDSIWAVGLKIAEDDGSGVVFDVLHFAETINLNAEVDVSFVNDYLSMYGYFYLDGLPAGEYQLIFTPYNYEEEAMSSYTYNITIVNANCNHLRYCDSSMCIYCKQVYSGDNIAHNYSLVYDERSHWDLCAGCGFICDMGAHYRYCDEDVCEKCNIDFTEIEIYHRELIYVGDEDVHFGYCQSCGYISDESYGHSRRCNQSVCKECGVSYTGQNYVHDGLVWSSTRAEHWYVCYDCGEASEKTEHERLCDADYCWTCFADYSGENITHGALDYVGDETGHYWYCHFCAIAVDEKKEHWRQCNDTICRGCRMPYTGSNVEHTDDPVIDEAIQATCTSSGKTMGSHCPDCGEVIIAQSIIEAKGHTAGEWIIVTQATATKDGLKEIRCVDCSFVLDTKVIPKTESGENVIPDPVVQTVNAQPGDTVTLDVYVSSIDAHVVTVQLSYDKSVFELLSTTCEEGQSNNGKFIVFSLEKIISGKIGTATLKIRDGIESGTYTVTANVMDAFDTNENATACKAAVDKVKVDANKLGDVNGDGMIDGRDLLRLAKYIGGYDVSVIVSNASVNGDSAIDGRDLLRLAKYIGGYDVELK